MSRRDLLVAYDGISIINGGMDSGQAPVTIGRSKVAFSRNVQFRRGQPATRPGIRRRPLLFSDATTQLRFEESLFQGASPYSPYSGGAKLVAQIGGRTFKLDVDTNYMVSDLSLTGDLNPSTRPKSWFVQAEDFLVIQDGQSAALIYDGVTLRRVIPSSVPNEIPVGTVMEYSMGRIWVTLPNGRSFVAGDLAYSDSGTAAYNNRDAVLKFTENDFLNEGGEFGVPSDVGVITAMRAIAVLDTSLGQGPLQVMAERGIFSVDAPFDRTEWKNLERPIQTVSLMGNGARSHESAIGINGDLWFRSSDGIRSFQVARRDFGAWVNTPVSTEMAAIIDLDDRTLLQHSSAAIFDNRYLLTSSPARVAGHGVIWRGLIALDFDNVSGLTARSAPAYDGFWTGLDILQVVPLDDRLFYFVLNSASKIELWEQTRHDEFDNQGSATPTRISCFIDTPAFDFADKGWDRKVIATADTWWRDLAGYVDFNVEWRPDDHECWTQWHSWCVDSKRTTCLDECGFPLSLRPQYRPRMRLPLPPDTCNEKANMPLRHGFHHQLRIAWTGHARLTKLRLTAHEWQEEAEPFCEPCEAPESDITGVACCDTSLFAYRSLYYSASVSVSCEDDQELIENDELPSWLSVSGSSLVLTSGYFTASTQASADALALAYVTDYLANGLETGALDCGLPDPDLPIPLSIEGEGCGFWLKAEQFDLADGTPIGDGANTWPNLVSDGNGHAASQSTAAARPLFKTNIFGVRPAIRFDGVDDFLTIAPSYSLEGASFNQAGTMFIVFKMTADGVLGGVIGGSQSGIVSTTATKFWDSFPTVFNAGAFTTSPTSVRVLVFRNSLTINDEMFRENKANKGPVNRTALGSVFSLIGKTGFTPPAMTTSTWFGGDIAEIICYCHRLTDEECDTMYDDYFKVRYPALP